MRAPVRAPGSAERLAVYVVTRVLMLVAAVAVLAVAWRARGADRDLAPAAVVAPQPAILEQVRIEEQLGAKVPPGARFVAADGRTVELGSLLSHGRPVVLTLVYFDCPMLCGLVLEGLARGVKQSGLELGKDFDAVTVSFDPRDRPAVAAERQRAYLQAAGRPGAAGAWSFLTGEEHDIRALTDAVGFHYAYDAASKQFAHPAVVMVLMPDGRVSRYLYGVEFPPKDLRLAVVEAGGGRVGTALDRVLLTCYRYDPSTRGYAPYALGVIKIGAALGVGVLAVALGVFWRREWRKGGVR